MICPDRNKSLYTIYRSEKKLDFVQSSYICKAVLIPTQQSTNAIDLQKKFHKR